MKNNKSFNHLIKSSIVSYYGKCNFSLFSRNNNNIFTLYDIKYLYDNKLQKLIYLMVIFSTMEYLPIKMIDIIIPVQ